MHPNVLAFIVLVGLVGSASALSQTHIDVCPNCAACVAQDVGFSCTCEPGFMGVLCATDINECASNPCLNGATCVDQVNGYVCKCTDYFEGTFCEHAIPPPPPPACDPLTCYGTCQPDGVCRCADATSGGRYCLPCIELPHWYGESYGTTCDPMHNVSVATDGNPDHAFEIMTDEPIYTLSDDEFSLFVFRVDDTRHWWVLETYTRLDSADSGWFLAQIQYVLSCCNDDIPIASSVSKVFQALSHKLKGKSSTSSSGLKTSPRLHGMVSTADWIRVEKDVHLATHVQVGQPVSYVTVHAHGWQLDPTAGQQRQLDQSMLHEGAPGDAVCTGFLDSLGIFQAKNYERTCDALAGSGWEPDPLGKCFQVQMDHLGRVSVPEVQCATPTEM